MVVECSGYPPTRILSEHSKTGVPVALHVLPSHRGLDRRAPAWHTVHHHIALSVRPPFGRPCPHNMSCSHILGGIILRPDSSPNRFSHTVSSVVTGTSFPDSDAAPIGQQPVAFRVFSVCNEDFGSQREWRFESGVLYRENKSDQASYRLRFPCFSAPCDGILGDSTYSMAKIFARNGAAFSLMPLQLLLHINRGDRFLANSTKFLLH